MLRVAAVWCLLIPLLILTAIILFTLSFNIRQRALSSNFNSYDKMTSIYSILAVVFYLITIVSFLIGETLTSSLKNAIYWYGLPYVITSLTWATGTILTYLLFIHRIKKAFENIEYLQVSKKLLIIIYILISIYYLCQFLQSLAELFGVLHVHIASNFTNAVFDIGSNTELCIDLLLSLLLLYLFISKLMFFKPNEISQSHVHSNTTRSTGTTGCQKQANCHDKPGNINTKVNSIKNDNYYNNSGDINYNHSTSEITSELTTFSSNLLSNLSLEEHQEKLIELMTKQTVLSVFAILSTDTCLIYDTILAYLLTYDSKMDVNYDNFGDDNDNNKDDEDGVDVRFVYWLHLIGIVLFSIDSMVNSALILFTFHFADTKYYKLCNCCHMWCFHHCIEKEYRKQLDLYKVRINDDENANNSNLTIIESEEQPDNCKQTDLTFSESVKDSVSQN